MKRISVTTVVFLLAFTLLSSTTWAALSQIWPFVEDEIARPTTWRESIAWHDTTGSEPRAIGHWEKPMSIWQCSVPQAGFIPHRHCGVRMKVVML